MKIYHPTVSEKFKIFSILGFDTKERKTLLCVLALISNENHETFGAIFLHLKKAFGFNPKYITSDFNKACISAINVNNEIDSSLHFIE